LGLPRRDVLVHCVMRQIGPTAGGPATVLGALRDVVGPHATVVVSAQTPSNSTTSPAFRCATMGVDPSQLGEYEAAIPGFHPRTTPSEGMRALAEHVRLAAGAVRSTHPQASFSALGPNAAAHRAIHDLDCHLGERSPLAALYAADASILMLGVGYEVCTAIHLAEYWSDRPPSTRRYRCFTNEGGRRVQHDFVAADLDDSDFGQLGADAERAGLVVVGRVGDAPARLVRMPVLVDFAIRWLNEHRRG
ncbi:MAG: aminoglycoside N(3)-acetyltransferase, partial [Actinomycetes bacterium]